VARAISGVLPADIAAPGEVSGGDVDRFEISGFGSGIRP